MESFLPSFPDQILKMFLNGYFQMLIVIIFMMFLMEREHKKSSMKVLADMDRLNQHWESVVSDLKKSHASEKKTNDR